MKPLLLFLIIYNLRVIVHSLEDDKESVLFKSYPKKVHQSQMFNAKLINSARFVKTMPPMMKTKKSGKMDTSYTVFPKVSTIVPDSPYFPIDFDFFHKHKEKKLLPRSKRSAPTNPNGPAPAKVAKAAEAIKAADKPKDSKPKENKPKSDNTKVNKAKPAAMPNKGILKQESKPKPAKIANSAGKITKPVSKGLRKRKSRRGVPHRPGKHNNKTNKGGLPRQVGRQGKKPKRHSQKIGTKVKKPGQKGKRQLQRNKKGSRKNLNQASKPIPHKAPERRLIAARDGSAEDYPYMISIQKDDEHWCSGALLNRRLIISTANCFWKSTSLSRMMVRAGSRHVDQGGQEAYIQEVMKHPGWSIRTNPPDYDIALALLDRTLKFSHSVHGVDLPNRAMIPPFEDFWVTSFGSERRDGVYERHGKRLQIYHTRLMDHDKCNNITQRFGVSVSENFICLTQVGRRAPCTRDTGAPAVSDGILWGLASWGLRKLCGTERYPSMFSDIASSSNMDFIINATTILMSENREDPMLDRFPRKMYAKAGLDGHTHHAPHTRPPFTGRG